MQSRHRLLIEVLLTTLILVLLCRVLFSLTFIPFIADYYSTIFAVLFLYAPIFLLWRARRPIDFVERTSLQYLKAFGMFAAAALIVFPLFLLAAHVWMKVVYDASTWHLASFPNFWKFAATQLLMVALPEEFFFRGYMQTSFDSVWRRKWRILGADLGWGWILTAIVFAFAHTLVFFQWWHFSIFFPALIFGYLRARSGGIFASILFHASCNTIMEWIIRCYA